ncbi:hypothetical protein GQ54DRAFT_183427 [Martensiomyces pterosporus]|nr:hypothetical protein GQ54DRAFT_183427 [Martensiomyces pterosporus]
MPRPTRKAAIASRAKKPAAAAAAKPAQSKKDKENASTSTKHTSERQLRTRTANQTATPKSKRTALADLSEGSPPKRPSIESPKGTPKSSPAYGRRSGMSHRLSASQNPRRLSGGSELVFDDLIDGFSPIKKDGPVEDLDDESLLGDADILSLALGAKRDGLAEPSVDGNSLDAADNTSASTVAPEEEAEDDDALEAEDPNDPAGSKPEVRDGQQPERPSGSEDSDSDLFDIDKLVATANQHGGSTKANGRHRPTRESMVATGELDAENWPGGNDASAQLPRRSKTGSSHAAKSATKPQPSSGSSKRRTRVVAKSSDTESDDSEGGSDGAADVWKPSNGAKSKAGKGRGPKAATAKPKAARGKTTRARAYGKKPAQAAPSALQTSPWTVDPAVAKYFNEIDDFELAEEVV